MIIKFLLDLKARGWTQKQIAEKAGIGQNMISKFYQGKTCTLETLIKIADGFNVPTDFILGRSPTRSGNNHYPGPERREQNDRLHIRNKRTGE